MEGFIICSDYFCDWGQQMIYLHREERGGGHISDLWLSHAFRKENAKWRSDWQRLGLSLVLESNIFYSQVISDNPVRADKMLRLETEKIMKPRFVF